MKHVNTTSTLFCFVLGSTLLVACTHSMEQTTAAEPAAKATPERTAHAETAPTEVPDTQEPTTTDERSVAEFGIDQIIVTATRRSESLMDVASAAIPSLFQPDETDPLPDPYSGRGPGMAGDQLDAIEENRFETVAASPLSTFSVDVDTASYTKLRTYIESGALPPPDSIRIEELLNYFPYQYGEPDAGHPFSIDIEVAHAPWQREHLIARVGIQGREPGESERRPANLVFLIDRSGSMQGADRLDLAKSGMRMLARTLDERDRVAIVAYANGTDLVLPSTRGDLGERIERAIDDLQAGGSTAGAKAIELAYDEALRNFQPEGINRVVLCTDGDFNVGTTDTASLVKMVEEYADRGISISVFGFGVGNHNDAMMEQISNRGDGNYAFVDSGREAKKVFVDGARATLETIAKDVKIQVEFNPLEVEAYRLIGYENRRLRAEDFRDDEKDAGEIGAGHQVTALYEIIPVGADTGTVPELQNLRYQRGRVTTGAARAGELMNVRLRYQPPDGGESRLIEIPVAAKARRFRRTSEDFQFAVAVAGFGMMLRESDHMGGNNWVLVDRLARESQGRDRAGHRRELVRLIEKARRIQRRER